MSQELHILQAGMLGLAVIATLMATLFTVERLTVAIAAKPRRIP